MLWVVPRWTLFGWIIATIALQTQHEMLPFWLWVTTAFAAVMQMALLARLPRSAQDGLLGVLWSLVFLYLPGGLVLEYRWGIPIPLWIKLFALICEIAWASRFIVIRDVGETIETNLSSSYRGSSV